jgi:putative Mg2+ transporter-C (MgtC) family protein
MSFWDTLCSALSEQFSDLHFASAIRVALRLILAAGLAGLLGWNRELRGKSAGLKTHMLVGTATALMAYLPLEINMASADLSRVIQGLLTGLGFIGGGAILKLTEEHRVEGVTTAASIWFTAAIGISSGLGKGATAVLATCVALVILALLGPLERWLDSHARP